VDETAFARRQSDVTVVTDPARGVVLPVADDRKTESLAGYYASLDAGQKENIKAVAMDLWPACIRATEAHIPGAREKIAFDKFHVAQYLGAAVDQVRRQEHRALLAEGNDRLTGSKYDWLTQPANGSRRAASGRCATAASRPRAPGRSRNSPWGCGTTAAAAGPRRAGAAGWLGPCAAAWRR
jgi:transposase